MADADVDVDVDEAVDEFDPVAVNGPRRHVQRGPAFVAPRTTPCMVPSQIEGFPSVATGQGQRFDRGKLMASKGGTDTASASASEAMGPHCPSLS